MFHRKKKNSYSKRSNILLAVFLITVIIVYTKLYSILESDDEPILNCTQLCSYAGNFTRNRLIFDVIHSIEHHPEFICPSNFRNLADWIYGCSSGFHQRIETTTQKGKQIAPCLPDGSIIYVSGSSIEKFFEKVYPYLINQFVLITGEGDESSPHDLKYLRRSNSKIIHWFGQNGQIDVSISNKFTHIPIGINCHEMSNAIRDIYKEQANYTFPSIYGDFDEPSHYIQPLDLTRQAFNMTQNFDRDNLLLINFDWHTDWTLTRRHIWKSLCQSKNRIPFVTCIEKFKGVNIQDLPEIYSRNREYLFWLSPRGNGIDCHRTWEALYLDAIPIVWNSTLNILYENLPVLIINNHLELTEEFLRKKLREISIKKYFQTKKFYKLEKLRHAYWRRLILSKSRHSVENNHIRTDLCWRAKTY